MGNRLRRSLPPSDEEFELQASSAFLGPLGPQDRSKPSSSSPSPLVFNPDKVVRDGWYIAKVVLRSFSLVFAIAIIAVEVYIWFTTPSYVREDGLPAMVFAFCTAIALWDTSEFITICARNGHGISPKAQIWLDLLLCLVSAGGVVIIFAQMGWVGDWWAGFFSSASVGAFAFYSAMLAMFLILVIIHFILFVRDIIDLRGRVAKSLAPRIMYLPTGQPVVVLPRPLLPLPLSSSPKLGGKQPASQGMPSPTAVAATSSFGSHYASRIPEGMGSAQGASVMSAAAVNERPRRKPVPVRANLPGGIWGDPGPEYQPDEAEMQRRMRGEAQAQWVALDGTGLVRPRRGDGPAEKFLAGGAAQRRNSA